MNNGVKILKLSYLLGAITDFVVFLMMIFPQFASSFWGFESFTEEYYFAMGLGAPLMLAWTLLLLWAYKKPVERKTIVLLTILAIIGIATTNIIMVTRGLFTVTEMLLSFIIQAILLALFGYGYWFTKAEKMV
jgi:hypothetical protein